MTMYNTVIMGFDSSTPPQPSNPINPYTALNYRIPIIRRLHISKRQNAYHSFVGVIINPITFKVVNMTYEEWLARQPKLEPMVRCVELSHPSWSEPLRIALDDANGTTVTESSVSGFYPFAPFSETQKNIGTSLDTGFDCQFGGYNKETLELFNETDFEQQEWIDYRSMKFNSTDTSYILEDNQLRVFGMELVHDASSQFAGFEAVPPRSKYNQTGESYNLTDVPMLEAFI